MDIYNKYPRESFKCHGELLNKDLWQQFHELDTEMIITRSGRRMFPALRMNLSNLDPDEYYCILLELTLLNAHKHKYSNSSGTDAQGAWAAAGPADVQSQRRLYVHPDGPATGRHWMYTAVSFGRLKLTNTMNAPSGHVVLASMHRYQPRVIVMRLCKHSVEMDMRGIQQLGLRGYELLPHDTILFQETAFMAVTAYQNHRITKLKIDNNPFAKGFRENGQSKSKRKRLHSIPSTVKQEERRECGDVDVDDSNLPDAHAITRTTVDSISNDYSSSFLSVSSESNSGISSAYPSPPPDISNGLLGISCMNREPLHAGPNHAPLDVLVNYYHHQIPTTPPVYIYYPHYYQPGPVQIHLQPSVFEAPVLPEDLSVQHLPKKPRKSTDFSIKALIGFS